MEHAALVKAVVRDHFEIFAVHVYNITRMVNAHCTLRF
jgi:hypothetical protein